MRPTGIGYRSPRERTPAYYTTYTNHRCESLFSPGLESRRRHVEDVAKTKKGFGMADRFLYVKMKARLAACQPNLSPANYNHHDQFRKMTQIPCTSVIRTLDIPKDEQVNYKYVGQSLVYDPETPMDPSMENTRLALPGNRGIFTHPALRPKTTGTARSRYNTAATGGQKSSRGQASVSHASSARIKKLSLSQVQSSVQDAEGDQNGSFDKDNNLVSNETSMTERQMKAASPKIIQETDCRKSSRAFDKNLFMSPTNGSQPVQPVHYSTRAGSGMRILPRLSASQAVNNFRDIYSEKDNNPKYRHVSHVDFHKSQEMIKKKKASFNGNEDEYQSKLIASSDGFGTNDPGFSSITPIGDTQHRRRVAQGVFSASGANYILKDGPLNSGIIDINNDETTAPNMASAKRSLEETQKTTVRSNKSGSMHSRRTQSIRSLKSKHRQSRNSEMQTNDFYVVGSLDTINVNYKVDKERQRVEAKPLLQSQ